MDERIENYLRNVFMRSSSPVYLSAAYFYEREVSVKGESGKGEEYEAVLSGSLFRITIRETHLFSSRFKKAVENGEYLIDGKRSPKFTMEEILSILSSTGYRVIPSMKKDIMHILPINNFEFVRDKSGVISFYKGLSSVVGNEFVLSLKYSSLGEGKISLFSCFPTFDVDLALLSSLKLGSRDYKSDVDVKKRHAIIDYLKKLSYMLYEASFEQFDLIDYYRIIDLLQSSPANQSFVKEIRKRRRRREGDDYRRILTPFDFDYYADGFQDTEEERELFLRYYDKSMGEEEREEDGEKRKNALSVLGLDENATKEDIRDAYRRLLMRFHPDTISSYGLADEFLEFANEKVQKITEAYKFLMGEM